MNRLEEETLDEEIISNHSGPGPDLTNTKRIPESRKLELIIHDDKLQDDNFNDVQGPLSLSRINYMLYQLGCMRKVYENYRAHESQIAQMTFSIPTWMRDYTVVEDQTPFIETTIKYFESVLDHYAKSRMVSDFDEIKSFQSGAFEEMGHTNSTQQISTTEGYKISIAARSCRPGRGDSFGAKVAGRISHSDRRFNDDVDDDDNELILDYENVDHTIMIELLFYDSDEDKGDNAPIGALWLPVVDIINYNARLSNEDTGSSDLHNNSSTRIDSWFAVTPIGKVQLRINFTEHPRDLLSKSETDGYPPDRLPPQRYEDYRHPDAGHDFVFKDFDHPMRCALCTKYCSPFTLTGQCKLCKILCHSMCLGPNNSGYHMPLCLNTSYPSWMGNPIFKAVEFRHQWEPHFNVSTNWCSHCGYFLSLGQGNNEGANKRCKACGQTCHAQCQRLVADLCGVDPSRVRMRDTMVSPFYR